MEGDVHNTARASWDMGSLPSVECLRIERSDSPTPDLVEGTEPGEAATFPIHDMVYCF